MRPGLCSEAPTGDAGGHTRGNPGRSWLRWALCQRPAGDLGCPGSRGSCGSSEGSEAKDLMSPSLTGGSLYWGEAVSKVDTGWGGWSRR